VNNPVCVLPLIYVIAVMWTLGFVLSSNFLQPGRGVLPPTSLTLQVPQVQAVHVQIRCMTAHVGCAKGRCRNNPVHLSTITKAAIHCLLWQTRGILLLSFYTRCTRQPGRKLGHIRPVLPAYHSCCACVINPFKCCCPCPFLLDPLLYI
jgi:hypothetical protein